MNMQQAYRLSTHYLAMFSALYCGAMGWLLEDPSHLKTVNDLTHGHAALLSLFNGLLLVYNLLHNPKTMKMVEAFVNELPGPEPSGIGNPPPAPRKPPLPVHYAPQEALPQPPEPDAG